MNCELQRQTEAHKARLSRFGVSVVPPLPVVRRPPARKPAPRPVHFAASAPLDDTDLWIYHGVKPPSIAARVKYILWTVADDHGLTVEDLQSDCRRNRTVFARMIAIHRLRRAFPDWGYIRIGRAINRDHATVMYSLGLLKRKPALLAEVIAAI